MKIKWFGHSSFLITSLDDTRVILDPYKSGAYGGALSYAPINEPADVVVMSHEHQDHGDTSEVQGTPILIRGAGHFLACGIEFYGVETFHDSNEGQERGRNIVFTFTVDGVKICHLGDLGHVLTDDQAAAIGAVDVLLAPVGGHFTIGPEDALAVADLLSAKVVIPMHYRTNKCDFPLASVNEFLKIAGESRRTGTSEITITPERLPDNREVIVLESAR